MGCVIVEADFDIVETEPRGENGIGLIDKTPRCRARGDVRLVRDHHETKAAALKSGTSLLDAVDDLNWLACRNGVRAAIPYVITDEDAVTIKKHRALHQTALPSRMLYNASSFPCKGPTLAEPQFLVIGASGLIGRRLLRTLAPGRAVGTHHRHAFPGSVSFDLRMDKVTDLLDRVGQNFSHGVLVGGVVNIDNCARDPTGSAAANVDGIIRVIDGLVARGITPIFASSDAVYDGSHGMWREEDATASILAYGRQKRAVERYLEQSGAPFIALRIAKVLDPDLGETGVLGPWIKELSGGKLIRCATDQRFCPVGVDDVVSAMLSLVEARATGIFNLGGAEPVSRIELLEMTVATLARSCTIRPIIERCSIRDFAFLEPRPFDLTVSIEKLAATVAYRPEPLAALCARAVQKALA